MHARNVVALGGRLTAEPVLKTTPAGPVLEFGLAINRSIRKDDGSYDDTLDGFFDIEVFGSVAEVGAAKLHKGTEVQVCGALHQNRFETKTGQKVSKVIVRAKTISTVLAPPRRQQQESPAQEPVGAVA